MSTGGVTSVFAGHKGEITALLNLGFDRFATGSKDGNIKIWDIKTEECIQTLESKNQVIYNLLLAKNGTLVSGNNGEIKLWNLNTGESTGTLKIPNITGKFENLLYFNPIKNILINSTIENIYLWDLTTMTKVFNFETKKKICSILVHPTSKNLMLIGSTSTISSCNVFNGKLFKQHDIKTGDINCMVFLNETKSIIIAGSVKKFKICNFDTGEILKEVADANNIHNILFLGNDLNYIITKCEDSNIRIYDLEKSVCVQTIACSSKVTYLSNYL